MLVRAFRLTDRLGNSLLRVSAWSAMSLAGPAAYIKQVLRDIFMVLWGTLVRLVLLITASGKRGAAVARRSTVAVTSGASTISRGAAIITRGAVGTTRDVVETTSARRQEMMVQRAAEAELKPTFTEDPLLVQNRALSAFAVLLLLALLAVVVIQTTGGGDSETVVPPRGSGGAAGLAPPASTPTAAVFPTDTPTPTPVPDPLRGGGSLVYTLRDNGQEDLWVIGVGQTDPIRLTYSLADDRDPAWSPDGTRIAYTSRQNGNWDLYILRLETGEVTQLTDTPGFEGAPTWSPDGQWLAYEGYSADTENLDIYIISTNPDDATVALRVTYAPGPDIEPAWIPGEGRHIAYVSGRDGNQDIYLIDLGPVANREDSALNLTNTPDTNEDYPAWSPDGFQIAYSASVSGVEGIYTKLANRPGDEPMLVGRGSMPTWSPDGKSVAYTLDYGRQTQIIADSIGGFGRNIDAISLPSHAYDPDWTSYPLPSGLIQTEGILADTPPSPPLYVETERQNSNGLYGLAPLNNVDAPQAYLSSRVNDSFEAWRQAVLQKTGYDFLGALEDAFWAQDRPSEPGEPRRNWHYTGRAVAIDRNLVYADPPLRIVVVREDVDVRTTWRVYLRVASDAQTGVLGEPLRRVPWDFKARSSGDVEDYERGGRLMSSVPTGYYIDLTQLAEDFGWERLPAGPTWQYNFGAIQFWEFHKPDGLDWEQAMLEIYTPEELQAFLSRATPVPVTPEPTEAPAPGVRASPTPIPPDMQ